MLDRLRKHLRQPYPFFHTGRDRYRIACFILLFGFLIEYVIIPFDRDPTEYKFPFVVIAWVHVAVAVLCYGMYTLILAPRVGRGPLWTIQKELTFFVLLFPIIGVAEWWVRDWIYVNPANRELEYLLVEVWHATLYGFILAALIIRVHLLFFIKRKRSRPSTVVEQAPRSEAGVIFIQAAVTADNFRLDPSQLVCVKSDGNYLEFYQRSGQKIEKQLKRMTLASATDQLTTFSFIFRSHRTYLVNLNHVTKIEGNAQGYQLHVEGLPFKVPVSRKYLEEFDDRLEVTQGR